VTLPADAPRPAGERWLVACLCAAWCRTCDEYRPTFETVAGTHPDMRFAWIDIEDESDALGALALEVEDFPTVLVALDEDVRFFGTLPVAGLDAERLRLLHDAGERIDVRA